MSDAPSGLRWELRSCDRQVPLRAERDTARKAGAVGVLQVGYGQFTLSVAASNQRRQEQPLGTGRELLPAFSRDRLPDLL